MRYDDDSDRSIWTTKLTWTNMDKSTQLHDAFIGHVRRRHDYTSYWLAVANLGQLVLGNLTTHVLQRGRSAGLESSLRTGVQFSLAYTYVLWMML